MRLRSVLMICLIGIVIFPWQLADFCATHPMGHAHHEHEPGKPTPCELRMQFKDITAYWPPMDCYKLSADTDDFQQPEKLRPTIPTLAFIAVLSSIIQRVFPRTLFILLPDPQSNSDPPLQANTLRGPPICLPAVV